MAEMNNEDSNYQVNEVILGATRSEGGTRRQTYRIGGDQALPFTGPQESRRLIALEICDDPQFWSPIVCETMGDLVDDPAGWAREAETVLGADLVRFYFTSTRRRGFDDFALVSRTMEEILQATSSPLIIEGSNEPALDSEVYRRCGETGEGECLLLGTAEADRYRSVAAAALAYGHSVIAQTPIDINLAKQLNILLRETGIDANHIVIDPYTGALGYGFEYSYSVMERIRSVALKGDTDLAQPMISAAIDSLNVKEVREADAQIREEIAIRWEFFASLSAFVAGAEIVGVRHPRTVELLRQTLDALGGSQHTEEVAYGNEGA